MSARLGLLGLCWLGLLGGGAVAAPRPRAIAERLRAAKELFFDKKYDEARQAWQAVSAAARGRTPKSAAYWVARCSENLGELERAFGEYGDYLARPPADRALAEEARTSRVGIAARLYKAGNKQHLPVLSAALVDPEQDRPLLRGAPARAGLGASVGLPAVPVLKRIVAEEKDDDLVERAKVCLLRLEPRPSLVASALRRTRKAASWIRVRIYDKGEAQRRRSRSTCRWPWPTSCSRACPTTRAAQLADQGLRRRQLLGSAEEARAHRDHRHSRGRRRKGPDLDRVGGGMRRSARLDGHWPRRGAGGALAGPCRPTVPPRTTWRSCGARWPKRRRAPPTRRRRGPRRRRRPGEAPGREDRAPVAAGAHQGEATAGRRSR